MYRPIAKALFILEPEVAHHFVMSKLNSLYVMGPTRAFLKSNFQIKDSKLERTFCGITFPNPVGLAAGFDKNGEYVDPLSCLGFGYIEIGTVTPLPQAGSPKPRLFRLPEDKALINRMGFNNLGSKAVAEQLSKRKERIIIGGNIGKNKNTPNEDAVHDYETCFRDLYEVVDYFVINVSSPNTPELRALQDKEPLSKILNRLMEVNTELGNPKPILLKIAPDLTNEQLDDIIETINSTGIHGIVATNTTIDRSNLKTPNSKVENIGAGGLSGKPLSARATEVVRYIHTKSNGQIPIMAVGGIFTTQDAIEKLNAGATLVQLYTGFIYEGPSIVKNICRGILKG